MVNYITNPNKRCVYCNGREVITTDDDGKIIANSLTPCVSMDALMCKDRDECRQNVDAENTIVSYGVDDTGVKEIIVTKNGKIVTQALSADGKPMEDWWK